MTLWEWWQSGKADLLTAGLAGSAVSAAMEWTGILPAIRKIVIGTLAALYLSPLAVPMLGWILDGLHVPDENTTGLSGFLMGIVGIVVIEIILKAFNLRRDKLLVGVGFQKISPSIDPIIAPAAPELEGDTK